MWKKRPTGSDTSEGSHSWEPLPPSNVRNAVKQLQWGPGAGELAVNCITNVYILREQILAACYNQQVRNKLFFLSLGDVKIVTVRHLDPK